MPLGTAVLTGAGRLDYRAIIHVAGINMFWRASERSIRGSVSSPMRIVEERGFASVAFPIISAGSGGFNTEGALAIMMDAFSPIETRAQVKIVRYQRRSA